MQKPCQVILLLKPSKEQTVGWCTALDDLEAVIIINAIRLVIALEHH
jgi:hypothetical protein